MQEVRLSDDGLRTWLGQWIRTVHPRFAPNIDASFESASKITDADRRRALGERERLIGTLRRHLEGDTVLCLPSVWTIASLKTAPSVELAANRVEDLTLGRRASGQHSRDDGQLRDRARSASLTVETLLDAWEKDVDRTPDPRLRSGSEEPVTDSYQVTPNDM